MDRKKISLLIFGIVILSLYYLWQSFGKMSFLEFAGKVFLLGFLAKITEKNIKERIYSDKLTLPAMGIGVFINALVAFNIFQMSGDYSIFVQKIGLSIGGLLLGGSCFYVLGLIGDWIFKKESLGGGDIKLAAAIGSFVGPMVIWFVPIWFAVTWIFALIYKVMGLFKKQNVPSSVPTVLGHFVALVILLSIQAGVFNLLTGLLGLAVLFLGADYLFTKTEKI